MSKNRNNQQEGWRKQLRAFWRRRFKKALLELKWPLVLAIWILSVILGYIGFCRYFEAEGTSLTKI